MAPSTSFRQLYDSPPHDLIQQQQQQQKHVPSPRTTPALSSLEIPNEIINAPDLANNLVHWAQGYLDQVQHSPSQQLIQSSPMICTQLGRSQAGSVGTVTSLYARTIETWSSEFMADADNVSHQTVRFENGGRSDWKWVKGDEVRMVVEHKGGDVFDKYCYEIRSLAMSSAALEFEPDGYVKGASAILVNLGTQMIAHNCQFAGIFGGQNFILLAMVDLHRNRGLVHQLQCSDILQTIPDPNTGLPGAFQVTIAALLGPKEAFFDANGITFGIIQTRNWATTIRGASRMEEGNEGAKRVQAGLGSFAGISQVKVSSYGFPKSGRLYTRIDKADLASEPESPNKTDTGELILYDIIGGSFSGTIIDADFVNQNGESAELIAKFYDADQEALIEEAEAEADDISDGAVEEESGDEGPEEEEEAGSEDPESERGQEQTPPLPNKERETAFRREIEAYNRLPNTDTSICPRFYGALQGTDNAGYQTGIILIEKLPTVFEWLSEMSETEKQITYEHVLELHRRGVHHGDVREGNIGRRELPAKTGSKRKRAEKAEESEVVIFDFSHAGVFEECDIEQCWEIRFARERLLEGGPK